MSLVLERPALVQEKLALPFNVSATLNGHRRAAEAMGISLQGAYRRGAERAFEFAGWAREAGVRHVTLYALSCDNLKKRPPEQLEALQEGAIEFCDLIDESDVPLHVFGDLEALEANERYKPLFERLARFQSYDPACDFCVHVAVNYIGSVEHELEPLVQALYGPGFNYVRKMGYRHFIRSAGVPDVDLAIRTGGERRTSGFVPFQMAYAELYFVEKFWIDFTKTDFEEALAEFGRRKRTRGA